MEGGLKTFWQGDILVTVLGNWHKTLSINKMEILKKNSPLLKNSDGSASLTK